MTSIKNEKKNTEQGTAFDSVENASLRNDKVGTVTFTPLIDIYDMSDRYEMRVELPGASPDQIEATVENGILTIGAQVPNRYAEGIQPLHGEYGVGDFRRHVRLGEDVESDQVSAEYAHGVLTLTLPKCAQRQPRRIPVVAN